MRIFLGDGGVHGHSKAEKRLEGAQGGAKTRSPNPASLDPARSWAMEHQARAKPFVGRQTMPKRSSSENRMSDILLIAPLPGTESTTSVIGGTKIMAAEQVRQLRMRGLDLDILDSLASVTNMPTWKIQVTRFIRFLRVVWLTVARVRRSRIIFLIIAPYSAAIMASVVWVISRLAHRPMVLRFSGGDADLVYRNYGALARWTADRTWMRCALVYVESQRLYREFGPLTNVRWHPTVRDVEAPAAARRGVPRKLIFIARLEMDKGLAEALDACRHLPENCHLRVFGPRMPDTDFSLFGGHLRADYGGVLDPEEVPRALSEHDLLLYPSYFRSEGYPNTILEAFQCGIPVVAARWGGVSELVEHEENGLLVEPRSTVAVRSAIERLIEDPGLYRRLCEGARRRGEYFRSRTWYDRMASDLRSVGRQTMPKRSSSENRMSDILLIAPLPGTESTTSVIGGTKIMAAEQVRQLRMRGLDLDILDSLASVTNMPTWKIQVTRFIRFLRVVWLTVARVRRSRIIFLIIAPYSAAIMASVVWVISRLAHRPMVLRFSGGDADLVYRNYGALARWTADRTWMRCALVYVQSQRLYREFGPLTNVRWHPTVRDVEAPAAARRGVPRKLIFIARLEMDKGLAEALDACRHLPENCHLRVFGPRMPDTDFSLFGGHLRADYGGVLDPEEVPRALSEHDLLLYPSYFRGEGYPNTILEAFQCGIPVVAARWGGVSELVEHEENGLLVEPRSTVAVRSAIERLIEDPGLYRRLCEGARRRGEYFRSRTWYDRMASDLRSVCER